MFCLIPRIVVHSLSKKKNEWVFLQSSSFTKKKKKNTSSSLSGQTYGCIFFMKTEKKTILFFFSFFFLLYIHIYIRKFYIVATFLNHSFHLLSIDLKAVLKDTHDLAIGSHCFVILRSSIRTPKLAVRAMFNLHTVFARFSPRSRWPLAKGEREKRKGNKLKIRGKGKRRKEERMEEDLNGWKNKKSEIVRTSEKRKKKFFARVRAIMRAATCFLRAFRQRSSRMSKLVAMYISGNVCVACCIAR